MVITLKPNEAAEIKLDMRKDAQVSYQWTSSEPVNVDAHGDSTNAPKGFFHGTGKHGWFWRNRGTTSVTIRLETSGQYVTIKVSVKPLPPVILLPGSLA